MTKVKNGYLYVAIGQKYVNEAIKSAKTLSSCHPDSIIGLVTNQPVDSSLFTNIVLITFPDIENSHKMGYLSKIIGMQNTPFEKTIFVDTDTYFCSACNELFEILDYFDLLICHDYQEDSFAMPNDKPLNGYHTYNTGVIAYNKYASMELLKKWENIFREKMAIYWSDQPAFMEALLYVRMKVYSLQTMYNFRFNQFLPISFGKVKILHGRHPNMDEIGSIINRNTFHRVWNPRTWQCYSWQDPSSLREILAKKIKLLLGRRS